MTNSEVLVKFDDGSTITNQLNIIPEIKKIYEIKKKEMNGISFNASYFKEKNDKIYEKINGQLEIDGATMKIVKNDGDKEDIKMDTLGKIVNVTVKKGAVAIEKQNILYIEIISRSQMTRNIYTE